MEEFIKKVMEQGGTIHFNSLWVPGLDKELKKLERKVDWRKEEISNATIRKKW